MKKFYKLAVALIVLTGALNSVNAQDNMGIGTLAPEPSSILDLSADDKGFLAPRLTTTQRDAVVNPADGLLIYNTDDKTFWYFDGGINQWVQAIGPIGPQGPAGTNGINGINGTNGVDGQNGINGVDGQDGATGAQGIAGATGAQGIQGVAGNDGATGAQGVAGATGAQGLAGATGAQGIQGVAGATGAQGIAGATGAQGIQGVVGATGPQGIQGVAGNDGATGAQGIQGVAGNDGATGAQGVAGATGAQGIQGVAGNDGATGAQGVAGATGAQGIQGVAGNDGATGAQGVAGATGAQGIQGVAGNDGATGAQGIQGVAGNDGATGAQGIQGVAGATGAQGIQGVAGNDGATGAQGVAGATGAQGIQGVAGNDGATGAQGIQGVAGPTGAQGIQGVAGNDGATGAQGVAGATGAQGIQGVAGATGAQGIQGVAGNDGATGAQGPQGPAGAQGPAGPQGAQGPQGNTGATGPAGPVGCNTANRIIKSNGTSAVCSSILYENGGTLNISQTASTTGVLDALGAGTFGNGTYRARVGWYSGADPVVAPSADLWGLCGTFNESWWEVNTWNFYVYSQREKKRDLSPVNGELMDLVWNDIDKLTPYFYKFKAEEDILDPSNPSSKYRAQMRMGVMLDEVPDYIKDKTFTHLDLYGFAALTMAGLKGLKSEVEEIKSSVSNGNGLKKINEFGSATINGTSMVVNLPIEFIEMLNGEVPIIMLTASDPEIIVSVTKKSTNSFTITTSKSVSNLNVDWSAYAKVSYQHQVLGSKLEDVKGQLYTEDSEEEYIRNIFKKTSFQENASDYITPNSTDYKIKK